MPSDTFPDNTFYHLYLAMNSIEHELDISVCSDSDISDSSSDGISDPGLEIETIEEREEVSRETDLIENISKNQREIRATSIKMRQYKSQRDAFHNMVVGENSLRVQMLEYNTKLENELQQIRENKRSEAARTELEGTDAWKLVDNCICGERLLYGVGGDDYGIVGYKCDCTCNRMLHFKCILSIQESKCPWCRSPMLFGGPLGSRKRMHNEMHDESSIMMSEV